MREIIMGSLDNILRSYLAAEETSGLNTAEDSSVVEDSEEKTPAAQDVSPNNIRYYFFETDNPIDYRNLKTLVEKYGEQALDDLKKGLAGPGSNFSWDTAAYITNVYTERPRPDSVLYVANLSSDGKRTTDEKVYSNKKEEIVNGIPGVVAQEELLKNLRGKVFNESDQIIFDSDAKFVNKKFNDNYVRALMDNKNPNLAGEMNLPAFRENFSGAMYRVRSQGTEKQQLLTPIFGINNNDNFIKPGRAFLGTTEDFEALEQLAQESTPTPEVQEAPASGAPAPQGESVFKPVDEQQDTSIEKAKERFQKMAMNIVDSKITEYKESDPDANYYDGDFSIMRDLAKLQGKKMKIRKESQITSVTPATSPTSPGSSGTGLTSEQVKKEKKNLDKARAELDNVEKAVTKFEQAKGPSSAGSPGLMGKAASIDRVIYYFLNTPDLL